MKPNHHKSVVNISLHKYEKPALLRGYVSQFSHSLFVIEPYDCNILKHNHAKCVELSMSDLKGSGAIRASHCIGCCQCSPQTFGPSLCCHTESKKLTVFMFLRICFVPSLNFFCKTEFSRLADIRKIYLKCHKTKFPIVL